MGCRQGKQKAKADGPETFDAIPEPGTPPPVDPRLPINARQVFKLKKSWKGIKRNMEATGVEMFIRLFRNNNQLISLFKDFRDLSADDDILRENEALEHHALLVMSIIDEAICHIDEVDRIIDLCTRVGATHSRFTGFTSDLFWNIEEPYLHAVKNELGDRYNDSMHDIYQKIFKFVLNYIDKGINQAREKKACSEAELPKYSKAKTTKAQLRRQISLSKQEEFFGKDYDRDKIAEILRQESLERDYAKGEPRQSTSGLQVQNSKTALDAISDNSPLSEAGGGDIEESQPEVKDNAPLLEKPSTSENDIEEAKPEDLSEAIGDKQPLLQLADEFCNALDSDVVIKNTVMGNSAIENLRSNDISGEVETSQNESNCVADPSVGEANATEHS